VGSGKAEVGVPTVKEVEARRTTQGNRGSGSPDAAGARGQLGAGGVEDEGAPTNLVTATRWRPAIGSRGVGQWHTSVGLCSPLWLREHGLRRGNRGAQQRV
jgi:hypothetical protein